MPTRRLRLDRRSMRPRDYLREPFRFGRDADAVCVLPERGDVISQQVAVVQHQVAVLVRQHSDRFTARQVTSRFRFSKQYWSRCLHGEAWMGETVFAAAVSVALTNRL